MWYFFERWINTTCGRSEHRLNAVRNALNVSSIEANGVWTPRFKFETPFKPRSNFFERCWTLGKRLKAFLNDFEWSNLNASSHYQNGDLNSKQNETCPLHSFTKNGTHTNRQLAKLYYWCKLLKDSITPAGMALSWKLVLKNASPTPFIFFRDRLLGREEDEIWKYFRALIN